MHSGFEERRTFVIGNEQFKSHGYMAITVQGQEFIDEYRERIRTSDRSRLSIVISVANSGINRNYAVEGAPPWSWEAFQWEFPGGCFEGYDAVPFVVEDDLDYFLETNRGIICLGQHPIGELPFQPRTILRDGIRVSTEFGYYREVAYPWVFHHELGWVYLFGFDPENIWMYSEQLGMVWTSESQYPYIYRPADNSWLFLSSPFLRFVPSFDNLTLKKNIWLYNFRTEEWESYPGAGKDTNIPELESGRDYKLVP
jgi:hypothetical protein